MKEPDVPDYMLDSNEITFRTGSPNGETGRKIYSKPTLVFYGRIDLLTLTSSGAYPDNRCNNSNHQFDPGCSVGGTSDSF